MTLRLVALMSIVLLITLGSFALLVHFHQAEVMEELRHTITNVGRHTLRTLEESSSRFPAAAGVFDSEAGPLSIDGSDDGSHFIYTIEGTFDFDTSGDASEQDSHDDGKSQRRITTEKRLARKVEVFTQGAVSEEGESSDPLLRRTVEFELSGTLPSRVARNHIIIIHSSDEATVDSPRTNSAGDGQTQGMIPGMVAVLVDQIEAQTRPDRGLVLKIPRSKLAPQQNASNGSSTQATHAPPSVFTREDILFEVPTERFDKAYSALRTRSLLLFISILLLGTLLTASVVARTTRPLRRMDAAITALSAGNLDVSVKESGRGEISRLAKAFNKMARSLRASRERALEMTRREKLSALGQLASGIAHDVRNPLHSINLTLQNLEETSRPSDERSRTLFDRSLSIIRNEIRRLDKLVENFLRFAGTGRGEKQPTEIGPLLEETIRLVEKTAEGAGVRIHFAGNDARLFVSGEAESLRSAMLNLVLNSLESMPDGGDLTLSIQRDGPWARIVIADTGGGIPPALQEKVFEFSYSTKNEGSGLGLAMVHQIVVEEHAGRVEIDSAVGEGTKIDILLPLLDATEVD